METHHVGYACKDINSALAHVKQIYKVKEISDIIFDELQDAYVCLLNLQDGNRIELVAGEAVKNLINNTINLYHICYEVEDIQKAIESFKKTGATVISELKPAKLFDNRLVVFLQTELGIIELLETKKTPLSIEIARKFHIKHSGKSMQLRKKIIITGTFNIEPIYPFIRYLCETLNLNYYPELTAYNQVFQQLLNPNSELNRNINGINILLIRFDDWFHYQTDQCVNFSKLLEKYIIEFSQALSFSSENNIDQFIFICPSERREDKNFSKLYALLEEKLCSLSTQHRNLFFLKSTDINKRYSIENPYDQITNKLGHIPYSQEFYAALALLSVRTLHAMIRKPYKVIILDCDNTLWDGVCGEVGAAGIGLSSAYLTLQEKLLELHNAGLLLCLCSKNHEADVWDVFDNRADMLLKRNHFITWQINWEKKSYNIEKIASILNLNLEDFIFIDDNSLECIEVKQKFPQILTIQLPHQDYEIEEFCQYHWIFDHDKQTHEDSRRTEFYQQHIHREKLRENSYSLKDYLNNLELKISISPIIDEQIDRVAQLTQRTNQFNFTTIRRSASEITQLLQQNRTCLVTSVSDCFGDYGLVGVIIYGIESQTICVDTFLLSCRVLGKGVEHRMLAELAKLAAAKNLEKIKLQFSPTDKNTPAFNFIKNLDAVKEVYLGEFCSYIMDVHKALNIQYVPEENFPFYESKENSLKKNSSRYGEEKLINYVYENLKNPEQLLKNLNSNKSNLTNKNERENISSGEKELIEIWKAVLATHNINSDSDYISMGGDSLRATQIISKIYKAFNVEISIADIFIAKTIRNLHAMISYKNDSITDNKNGFLCIPKSKRESPLKLSFSQYWLWFLDQIDESSWYYNMPMAIRLRGQLNLEVLKKSFIALIQRHEALRTVFTYKENEPEQTVLENFELPFTILDVSRLNESEIYSLIDQENKKSFNLSRDLLIRIKILKKTETEHILLIVQHHIVSDGWSYAIMHRELSTFYNAYLSDKPIELPLLPIQYADFSEWQLKKFNEKSVEKQIQYWKRKLSNLPMMHLPVDYPRPARRTHEGKYFSFELSQELGNFLKDLTKESQCSIFVILLSVYSLLIAKYCKQNDIVIVSPISGRHHPDVENLIGCFVNLLILRLSVKEEFQFLDLVRETRQTTLEAYENQDVPFEVIVKNILINKQISQDALFQIMFAMQNVYQQSLSLSGIESDYFCKGYNAARLELILELEEINDKIEGGFYYNTHIYSEKTIKKITDNFVSMLQKIASDPEISIKYLLNDEVQSIISLKEIPSNTKEYPGFVHLLFETMAVKHPNAIALQFGREKLSYAELNIRSNQLAHYLRSKNIIPKDIIAIVLPPSIDLIVSIVTCYKLGCIYIPLDIRAPKAYVTTIIKEAQPKIIITHTDELNKYSDFSGILLDVNTEHAVITKFSKDNLPVMVNHGDLAYIIYTSGTTGKPKGVMIPHINLSKLLKNTEKIYRFNHTDTMVLFHSSAFDFSVWEMWITLCYGARLLILPYSIIQTVSEFYELLTTEKVTVLNQTPSAFYQLILYEETLKFLPDNFLRLIILGGETLNPIYLKPWITKHPKCKIFNMYGITEVTIHATYMEVLPEHMQDAKSLIGKPLPEYKLYILDEKMEKISPGITGEIYVSGTGVAKGYFKQPQLTEQKFIFHKIDGKEIRLYKSGDLARYINENDIEFIGRSEHQAKLRGHRIDLYGISNLLNQHEGVSIGFVKINDKNSLAAYIIPKAKTAYPILKFLNFKNELEKADKKFYDLPNGMTVAHINKNETDYLYGEIFLKEEYLKHGITIKSGDCILDVGANIGLFSLFMSQLESDLKIYAFEPIQDVFQLLTINVELYGLNVTCLNYGLYSENVTKSLIFYPKMTILSGMFANQNDEKYTIKSYFNSLSNSSDKENVEFDEQEINFLLDDKLESIEKTCELKTLSDFIEEYKIEEINLLKIDAEKCELDILNGIKQKDWNKIKQIVAEVHDRDNSLEEVTRILKLNNFSLIIDRDPLLKDTNLSIIYASKLSEIKLSQAVKEIKPFYRWNNIRALTNDIKNYLKSNVPEYMVPGEFFYLEKIPLTVNGKINWRLVDSTAVGTEYKEKENEIEIQDNELLNLIRKTWEEVLEKKDIGCDQNFFDIGGNSLLIIQIYAKLNTRLPNKLRVLDLFKYPTISALADYIHSKQEVKSTSDLSTKIDFKMHETDVAVVGMAARFPGADNIEQFWNNIRNGIDAIGRYTEKELAQMGVELAFISNENFVKASGIITDVDKFDANFFNYSPKEAAFIDPQQRIFLELAWHALESAGYCPDKYDGKIGIYAGMGNSRYFSYLEKYHHDFIIDNHLMVEFGNEKDYLATRVAHKLGLHGAAININTACSTSLVAVIKACQSLLLGENTMALAGGISILLPERAGYFYKREGILSPDGYCRPFSANSNGTVLGSGAGIVVLKRLSDAIRDGDAIRAVIKGYAINNDGHTKVGFTAPSLQGQARCVKAAQQFAQTNCEDITYIEAHGTGTILGDPLEIEALSSVFQENTQKKQFCALGSVKSNIGHADAAAGIAGLLKVILMLQHRELPPTLYYEKPNPHIDFSNSPFYVNTQLTSWHGNNTLLTAGVSSFGIGGTNAHVIVQSAPVQNNVPSKLEDYQLIILSAQTPAALTIMIDELRVFLQEHYDRGVSPDFFANVAYTLQVGRNELLFRQCWICRDIKDAIGKLKIKDQKLVVTRDMYSKRQSELITLANNWLNGIAVEWLTLYSNIKRYRIDLPGYPFIRQSYWYDRPKILHKPELKEMSGTTKLLEIENNLMHFYSEITHAIDLTSETDFLKIGGDSLQALTLLNKIETTFNVILGLDDIFDAPVIKNLSKKILRKKSSINQSAKVIKLKEGTKKTPLFLIHPTNGSLFHYKPLVRMLEIERPIYGIQNKAISTEAVEKDFSLIKNLAAVYIELIKDVHKKGPYLLAGWSFGGTIAFEMARQLELMDETVNQVILFDAWAKYWGKLKNKNYYETIYNSRSNYRTESETLNDWNDAIWERVKHLLDYSPDVIRSPVLLFKASELFEEYIPIADSSNHWETYVSNELQIVNVPGNHESLIREPCVKEIANKLEKTLVELE